MIFNNNNVILLSKGGGLGRWDTESHIDGASECKDRLDHLFAGQNFPQDRTGGDRKWCGAAADMGGRKTNIYQTICNKVNKYYKMFFYNYTTHRFTGRKTSLIKGKNGGIEDVEQG